MVTSQCLVENGIKWGGRFDFQLFDGSTNQEQTSYWDQTMPRLVFLRFSLRPAPGINFIISCQNQGGNWRTYAAVVWEAPYHYDKGK